MDYTAARREAIVSNAGAHKVTEDDEAAVRRLITRHAEDPNDQRLLLSTLGLLTDTAPATKACRTCKARKELGQFHRKPGSSDGRDGQCRGCSSTAKRLAYAAKREGATDAAARSREAADRRRREAAVGYLRAQGLSDREIESSLASMEGVTR